MDVHHSSRGLRGDTVRYSATVLPPQSVSVQYGTYRTGTVAMREAAPGERLDGLLVEAAPLALSMLVGARLAFLIYIWQQSVWPYGIIPLLASMDSSLEEIIKAGKMLPPPPKNPVDCSLEEVIKSGKMLPPHPKAKASGSMLPPSPKAKVLRSMLPPPAKAKASGSMPPPSPKAKVSGSMLPPPAKAKASGSILPPPPKELMPTKAAESKVHLIFCIDNSGSMRTNDVQSGDESMSRTAAVAQLCKQLVINQLSEHDGAARHMCSYLLFNDGSEVMFAGVPMGDVQATLEAKAPSRQVDGLEHRHLPHAHLPLFDAPYGILRAGPVTGQTSQKLGWVSRN